MLHRKMDEQKSRLGGGRFKKVQRFGRLGVEWFEERRKNRELGRDTLKKGGRIEKLGVLDSLNRSESGIGIVH